MVTESGVHLDLRENITSKAKKQNYVNRMFSVIAKRYDFITAFLSYGMDKGWKRKLVALSELEGHETVLDLACGTGDITFAIGKELSDGKAIGLDITQEMLVIAEKKKIAAGTHRVHFERSDIMRLPFPDESFDRVTGGYALRNVPDIPGALAEIKRVLKPGGRLLSLDFGKPKLGIYRWTYFQYLTIVGSLLGLVLHGDADTYRYIPESLKLYPGQYEVKNLMRAAGFLDVGHTDFMGGIMAINWGTKPKSGPRI